jgi:hypothetical protein
MNSTLTVMKACEKLNAPVLHVPVQAVVRLAGWEIIDAAVVMAEHSTEIAITAGAVPAS